MTLVFCFSAFNQPFTPYPELNQYIKLAVDSNPGLKEDKLKYLMSVERIKQRGVLPDPVLSGGVFLSPVETRVGPQRAKISVSQMFPWFGTLKAQSQQAYDASKAAYFRYLESANQLVYATKKTWYRIAFIDQQISVIKEQIDILEKLEKYMIVRFENNKAILSDVLDIQMEKEKIENRLHVLGLKKATLTTEFYNTLNINKQEKIATVSSFNEMTVPDIVIDSVFKSNFRLRELEYQQSASEAAQKESQQRAKPSFGLGLDYVFVGERNDIDIAGNGKDVIMPVVSLQLPVFRKKYTAAIEEKRLQTDMLQYREQQVKNNLDNRWKEVLNNYKIAKRDMNLSKSLLTRGEKSKEIVITAYETGNKTYTDVLRIQQKLFDFQLMNLEASHGLSQAIAELEYLMSGDFLATGDNIQITN